MAVYVARVVAGWARIEERLGLIMVSLLRAHARIGMKMYQALSGAAAQKAVLQACASDLPAEKQEELNMILRKFKMVAKKRNDVVHGHWEFSDQHPDDLVWIDGADSIQFQSEFWATYHSTEERRLLNTLLAFKPSKKTRPILYGKREFEEILDDINSLMGDLQTFDLSLDRRDEPPGDEPRLGNS